MFDAELVGARSATVAALRIAKRRSQAVPETHFFLGNIAVVKRVLRKVLDSFNPAI